MSQKELPVSEKVLCIYTPEESRFKPSHQILRMNDNSFVWIERELCESDPLFKQIIPYVIIYDTTNDKFLAYRRKTGDKRLQGKYSIGIGGHINEDDCEDTLTSTIISGIVRELTEELGYDKTSILNGIKPWDYFRGFIYDPSNDVGKVHVGFIFLLPAYLDPEKFNFETDEHVFELKSPAELIEIENLETWSEIFLDRFVNRKQHPAFYPYMEA